MDEIKPFTDRIKKLQDENLELKREVLSRILELEAGSANMDRLASDTYYREEAEKLADKWGLPLPE